jgi:hypothetical protein
MYSPCHSINHARTGNCSYRTERVVTRGWLGKIGIRVFVVLQHEWRYDLTGGALHVDRYGGTEWLDARPDDLINDPRIILSPALDKAGAA